MEETGFTMYWPDRDEMTVLDKPFKLEDPAICRRMSRAERRNFAEGRLKAMKRGFASQGSMEKKPRCVSNNDRPPVATAH